MPARSSQLPWSVTYRSETRRQVRVLPDRRPLIGLDRVPVEIEVDAIAFYRRAHLVERIPG